MYGVCEDTFCSPACSVGASTTRQLGNVDLHTAAIESVEHVGQAVSLRPLAKVTQVSL